MNTRALLVAFLMALGASLNIQRSYALKCYFCSFDESQPNLKKTEGQLIFDDERCEHKSMLRDDLLKPCNFSSPVCIWTRTTYPDGKKSVLRDCSSEEDTGGKIQCVESKKFYPKITCYCNDKDGCNDDTRVSALRSVGWKACPNWVSASLWILSLVLPLILY